jgi:P-type Cu+ transporter
MTRKVKLKITGMHCTSCAFSIDGDLEDNVVGVKSAKTNYAKQECEVEFDEDTTNLDLITKQIEKTGYNASVLPSNSPH